MVSNNLESMHISKPINKSVMTGLNSSPHGRQPIESPDQDMSGLVTDWNKQSQRRNPLSGENTDSNNITPAPSKSKIVGFEG